MIYSNFHTHTPRCKHAMGQEREYIEAAISVGMSELGFSDHCPIPFKTDFVSGIRMDMDEAYGYVETIRALGEEYKDKIKIYLGFECEYVEEFFEEQMEFYDSLGIDYLIMGAHFLENEEYARYTGALNRDEDFLIQYVDNCIKGCSTGRFAYLCHPDLIHYVGDDNIYKREMGRLCKALKELKVPVELNVLGYATNRQYPNPLFWDIVADEGNDVIMGIDAHTPDMLRDLSTYEGAMSILTMRNIEPKCLKIN